MKAYVRWIPKSIIPRFGGKFALINPISLEVQRCQLDNDNPCDTYIEPFMGGARIFLNSPMPPKVVLNEINQNICSLFRIIQRGGNDLDQLVNELQSIKYCKENFNEAKIITTQNDSNEMEQAISAYILAKQSVLNAWNNFSWCNENDPDFMVGYENKKKNIIKVQNYYKGIGNLYNFVHRLQYVKITCGDFRDILIKYQKCKSALVYCDPPYTSKDDYSSGWTHRDREDLVNILLKCECRVILSGYNTPLYNEKLANGEAMHPSGWRKMDLGNFHVASSKGKFKHEYIWLNYTLKNEASVHNLCTGNT
jgi:DNA adenine methylase